MLNVDLCIIGFGISGIAMTRWAINSNLQIITLEQQPSFGGVWLSKSYPSVYLQTTKYSYCFSDMPMNKDVGLHPTHLDILEYLKEYIHYHNLEKNVLFNSSVLSIKKDGEGLHRITYRNIKNNSINIIYSPYIAICSGLYTSPNNIPRNGYKGNISHISDFSPLKSYSKPLLYKKMFKNKNIVIIGNGPSGCDMACLSKKLGSKQTTILYRTPKWIFPRKIGLFSLNFLSNRLFLWLCTKLPVNIFLSVLFIIFYLPYYLFGFKNNFKLPNTIVNRNNLTLNEEVIKLINDNKINYIQTDSIILNKQQLVYYDNGKNRHILKPHYIIEATGYKNGIKFLNINKLPNLYKRILDPNDPSIAFIGFAPSFNWVQVSDLQARWFINKIINNTLPTISQMDEHLTSNLKGYEYLPYEYQDLAYLSYTYCDSLAKDLNIKPKSKTFWSNWWKVPRFNEWSN